VIDVRDDREVADQLGGHGAGGGNNQ
jgi:hypothetical protein